MEDKIPAGSQLPEKETVEETVEEAPKVYAGKYESPDDLENAYSSLEGKLGEMGGEVGALREQNRMLTEQLTSVQQQPQQQPEEPPKDYQSMLSEIAAKYEDNDITFEQALLQSNAITAEQVQANAMQQMQAKVSEVQNAFQQELTQRDEEKIVNSFYEENADFRELQESGKLEELKKTNPLHDDVSAYYALKAEIAYEKGKAEHAREMAGSKPAETVVNKPGVNTSVKQKPNRPLSEAEMKQSMLASLGG